MVESPCVDQCKIDQNTGFCIGCGRTKDEIKAWKNADDDLRREILDRLKGRRDAIMKLRQTV